MTARIGTLADGTCLLNKESDYQQLLLEFNLILLNAFSNNPLSSDSFWRGVEGFLLVDGVLLCTYWLSKVGPNGKLFGSRTGSTDLEPNIFPSGPTLLSQYAFYHMTTCCWKFWKFCFNLNRTRLHKIRRLRARNNNMSFYHKKIVIYFFYFFFFYFFASNKKLTIHRKTQLMFQL